LYGSSLADWWCPIVATVARAGLGPPYLPTSADSISVLRLCFLCAVQSAWLSCLNVVIIAEMTVLVLFHLLLDRQPRAAA
jgi:hypothetical protein